MCYTYQLQTSLLLLRLYARVDIAGFFYSKKCVVKKCHDDDLSQLHLNCSNLVYPKAIYVGKYIIFVSAHANVTNETQFTHVCI